MTKIFFVLLYFTFTAHALEKFEPKLYEIKSKKAVVGYLFGTRHAFVNAEDLPGPFWNYFRSAEAYAFESLDSDEDNEYDLFLSRSQYKAPKAPALDDLLTKKEIRNLKFYLTDYSEKDIQKILYYYSPFGLARKIEKALNRAFFDKENKKIGRDDGDGLDTELQKMVINNKPQYSLDAYSKEFFECAYDTRDDANLKMLKEILSHNYLKDIRDGKEGKYVSTLNESCVVIGRNQLWISKIVSLLKKKKTFIAVGNAHVDSEKHKPSLVSLLKNEGYEVNLIKL